MKALIYIEHGRMYSAWAWLRQSWMLQHGPRTVCHKSVCGYNIKSAPPNRWEGPILVLR